VIGKCKKKMKKIKQMQNQHNIVLAKRDYFVILPDFKINFNRGILHCRKNIRKDVR